MKFNRIIAAAIAAIAFAFAAPASAQNAKLHDQVLSVTAQLNENCSASLIYSDRDKVTGDVKTILLTAKHCVDGVSNKDQVVDFPVYKDNRIVKKDRYIGRVLGSYYKADLALIDLKDKQTFFARTSKIAGDKQEIAMGDPVVTVGYPLGKSLTVTQGLFGAFETADYPTDGVEYYRATPDIAPVNSGGALYRVLDDGDYQLIGVTTAGFQGFTFVNYYTPVTAIREYLKVALPAAIGVSVAVAPAGAK